MSLCVEVNPLSVANAGGPGPPCNTPWRPGSQELPRRSRTTVFQTRSHITKGFHLKQSTLSSHSLKQDRQILPKLSITSFSKGSNKGFTGIPKSNSHFSQTLAYPYSGILRGKSLISTTREYESSRLLENTPEPLFPVSPECEHKAMPSSRSFVSERRGYEFRPALSTGGMLFQTDDYESPPSNINLSLKLRDGGEITTIGSSNVSFKLGRDIIKNQVKGLPISPISPREDNAKSQTLPQSRSPLPPRNISPSSISGSDNVETQSSLASKRQNIGSQTTESSEEETVSSLQPLRESVRTQTEAKKNVLIPTKEENASRSFSKVSRAIQSNESHLSGGDDFGWKAIPAGEPTASGKQDFEYIAMPRSRSFVSSRQERVFTEMPDLARIPAEQEPDFSANYLANFPLGYRWRNRRRKLVPKLSHTSMVLSVVGNKPASIPSLPTLSQPRLNVTPHDWATGRPETHLENHILSPTRVSPGLRVKGRKMTQRSQYNLMNMRRDYKLGNVVNRVVHCDRMESHWIANDRHMCEFRCDNESSYHRGFMRYVDTTPHRDMDEWSVTAELSSASPFVEHAPDENLEDFYRPRTRPDLWRRDISVNRPDTRNSSSCSEKCSTEGPSQYSSVTDIMSATDVTESHGGVEVECSGESSAPPKEVERIGDDLDLSSITSTKTRSFTQIPECETSDGAAQAQSENTLTDAGATGSPSIFDTSSPVMSVSSQTQSTHDTSSTAVPVFSDSEEEKGSIKSESQTVVYRSSQNTSDALTFYSSSQAYPYSRETSSTCTCNLRNVTSLAERQAACSSTTADETQSVQTMTDTGPHEIIYKDATTSTSPLDDFQQPQKMMKGRKLSKKWSKRMNADSDVYWAEVDSRQEFKEVSSKRKGVLYETTPTPFGRQSYMFFTPVSDTRYDKWMRNNGKPKMANLVERRKSKSMTPSGGRFKVTTRKPNLHEDEECHYFRYTKNGTPTSDVVYRQRQTAAGEDIFYLTSPSLNLDDQKARMAKSGSKSDQSSQNSNPHLEDWLSSESSKYSAHHSSTLPPLTKILAEDSDIRNNKTPTTTSDGAIQSDGIKLAPSDHVTAGRPHSIVKEASDVETNVSATEPSRMNTDRTISSENGIDLAQSQGSVKSDKGTGRFWNSSSTSGSLHSNCNRVQTKRKSRATLDSCRSEQSTPRRSSLTTGIGHCSLITDGSFKVSSLLSKSTATYQHKSVVSKYGGPHKSCRKKKPRTPRNLSHPGPLTQKSKIFTLQEILRFLPNIGLVAAPNVKTGRREVAVKRKGGSKSPTKSNARPVGEKSESTEAIRTTHTSPAFTYSVFDLPPAYKKRDEDIQT